VTIVEINISPIHTYEIDGQNEHIKALEMRPPRDEKHHHPRRPPLAARRLPPAACRPPLSVLDPRPGDALCSVLRVCLFLQQKLRSQKIKSNKINTNKHK